MALKSELSIILSWLLAFITYEYFLILYNIHFFVSVEMNLMLLLGRAGEEKSETFFTCFFKLSRIYFYERVTFLLSENKH